MATYYVELNGGDIAPKTELVGGVIAPSVSFSGAQIYPTSGGGGTVTLQTKSVTYTPSTSQQTEQVTPDQGYDGLDKVNVTVDAVASGSVAVNNKQVTFTSPFSFNAATGKITSSSLYQNPITATVTPGYVDSATDGELTVYLNKTQQLDTVGATTYYPSTSDQTIATQQYLTGPQTIKGVTYSGLDAGNIKKDVVVKIGDSADDDRIVSVTGTYEGGTPTPDPYHISVDGTGCFFLWGGADWNNSRACQNSNTGNRRSIWSALGDTVVYFLTNNTRTNLHLIPIPSDATTMTLTIDKTCQFAVREYWGSGSSLTSSTSTSWLNITENTPYQFTLSSGSNYVGFSIRVNSSNTHYTNETEPTSASIDFS